jgi:hypothetical protein
MYTTHALSRRVADIPSRRPFFYRYCRCPPTGGPPITVLSQSISSVSAINPLVAFYHIYRRKGESVLLYLSSADILNMKWNKCVDLKSTSCCAETRARASRSCCAGYIHWCRARSTPPAAVPPPWGSPPTSPRTPTRASSCYRRQYIIPLY